MARQHPLCHGNSGAWQILKGSVSTGKDATSQGFITKLKLSFIFILLSGSWGTGVRWGAYIGFTWSVCPSVSAPSLPHFGVVASTVLDGLFIPLLNKVERRVGILESDYLSVCLSVCPSGWEDSSSITRKLPDWSYVILSSCDPAEDMTLKRFQHYWSFVRGIHWWLVESPHKRPLCGIWFTPLLSA